MSARSRAVSRRPRGLLTRLGLMSRTAVRMRVPGRSSQRPWAQTSPKQVWVAMASRTIYGGGALALEPAADGVFGVLGPPGFDVLREGVGVGDAEPLPPGLVAEAKQVPDDVVDVHLHAVGGKDIVPGDVFGPGVAQVQLRQQRRIQGAQRGLPVAQLAAEAFAGALPGAVHLAGGLAVGVEYLNLAHAITPAGPRRRGRAVPVSTSGWLM